MTTGLQLMNQQKVASVVKLTFNSLTLVLLSSAEALVSPRRASQSVELTNLEGKLSLFSSLADFQVCAKLDTNTNNNNTTSADDNNRCYAAS